MSIRPVTFRLCTCQWECWLQTPGSRSGQKSADMHQKHFIHTQSRPRLLLGRARQQSRRELCYSCWLCTPSVPLLPKATLQRDAGSLPCTPGSLRISPGLRAEPEDAALLGFSVLSSPGRMSESVQEGFPQPRTDETVSEHAS